MINENGKIGTITIKSKNDTLSGDRKIKFLYQKIN